MALEIITLNVNVKGDKPVFHCSQYDDGRPIIIDLVADDDAYIPAVDVTFELHCRKNDDHIVTLEPDTVTDNRVTFVSTEQLTACAGDNLCEVALLNNGHEIGTLNFILRVEPDPIDGGVDSASDIGTLTNQIAAIVPSVIGNDYYNKTETDALLANKADVSDLPDMTDYYTKTQTDNLLNAKADVSTTYTKIETDNLLSAKANAADLATVATTGDYDDLINTPSIPAAQIQSDYAQADNTQVDYIKNKPDIAGMIASAIFNILPVGSASGNPCSFDTEIAAELQGLTAEIVASGGDGTPGAPIPIVGYSEINLDVNGDTFTAAFGQTVYGGMYDAKTGKLTIDSAIVDFGDLSITYQSSYPRFRCSMPNNYRLPVAASDRLDIICSCYVPDMGAISGAVNYAIAGYYGDNNLYVSNSDYTDADIFKTAMTGQKIVYKIDTPIEIDLSSISPSAVVGTNTITSDCIGDVTASYKDSIQHYIDNQ